MGPKRGLVKPPNSRALVNYKDTHKNNACSTEIARCGALTPGTVEMS